MTSSISSAWNEIIRHSFDGMRPTLFENQIGKDLRKWYLDLTKKALVARVRSNELAGLRVYINGSSTSLQNIAFIRDCLNDNASLPIEEWGNELASKYNFGIIYNNVQGYNIELKNHFSLLTKLIVDVYGIPVQGFGMSIFYGNYGFTPLGVHQDPVGWSVFHLHLGPGTKTMYLIDENVYKNEISDEIKKLKPEEFLRKTKGQYEEFVIHPGDIFYMPESYYHIGLSLEFSVGITFWRQESSLEAYLKLFKDDFKNILFKNNDENEASLTDISGLEEFKKLFKKELKKGILDKNIGQLVDRNLELAKKKLLSNSYFLSKDRLTRSPIKIDLDSYVFIHEPFQIECIMQDENLLIAITKGHEIELPNTKGILYLINRLNDYDILKASEIYRELEDELEHDFIDYILIKLYSIFSIEIKKEIA